MDNTSVANVRDSVLYSRETPDAYAQYATLTPGMMKRVPFALGMEGTVRTLNVMADGQGRFKNCVIVSTGWGAISTDSGTAFDVCRSFALDVEDTLSGIGTLEVAKEGREYTAKKTVNGVTWGFTAGGSGYVTYADSGVHNRYRNVEFYSPITSRSSVLFRDLFLLFGVHHKALGAVFVLCSLPFPVSSFRIPLFRHPFYHSLRDYAPSFGP